MCLGMTGVITAIRDDDGVPMALIDTALIDTALIDTALIDTAPDAAVAAGLIPAGLIPAGLIPAGLIPAGLIPACLLTCQDARVGDTVLVHSGYVLQIFDPPDSQEDQS